MALAAYGLRTLPRRAGGSGVMVLGIAGVVMVWIGVLSIAAGFRRASIDGSRPEMAVVLRAGADSELVSALSRAQTRLIGQAPGVARDALGPLVSPELFLILDLPRRSTGTAVNVAVRGVEPPAFRVRRELVIEEGRAFLWGRAELLVGVGASRVFAGLEVGREFEMGGRSWQIVGTFSTGGPEDSELWADARVLQSLYRRGDTFQAAYAELVDADAFSGFQRALDRDPRARVRVMRQTEHRAAQSRMVMGVVRGLGRWVALLMGAGASLGAFHTLHSLVVSRRREIATLRALGFRGPVIVSAFLMEALVLGLAGGVLGVGLAYGLCNGWTTATLNVQTHAQVAFALEVDGRLMLEGLGYGLGIGAAGGVWPAIGAVRGPIARALGRS